MIVDFRLSRDPHGDVEILKRFWSFDAEVCAAPIPLIYADLIRIYDARCIETAQMIYEQFVSDFHRKFEHVSGVR
jgi:hypothetical protein